jgi:hypothetical protein
MTYLPIRLPKLLGLAAAAALGLTLFAGSGSAVAAPGQGLSGLSASGLPVEQAGYYKRYSRYYKPYVTQDYPADYGRRVYRPYYGNGADEIRELQRLFPETNWPPSMRYHQY